MFGNDNQGQPQSGPVTSPTGVTNDDSVNNNNGHDMPAAPAGPSNNPASIFPAADDNSANDPFGTTPANNNGDGLQPHQDEPSSQPVNNPFDDVVAGASHDDHQQPAAHQSDDSLVGIKQEALQQLSPLVKHLDQSPEEKFKTTMMMIQASDDQSLVPEAFEAAKNIPDDKARAQALLDIINEINYFTQNTHS